MASQSEKASVISTMRACILSCKGGIQINALDRDYRSLEGSPIPYKMLGYSTLEALIKDTPDLHLKAGIVQADIAESSAHIAAMVNRQKSTAKSKARGRPPPPSSHSHKWGFSKSKPKYPPSRPPQPRYSAPAKMRTPSPPPRQYSNANASTPLSITIGVEDRQPRKVIVDRNNSDEGHSRGAYELPPRFHKTEANMKKGPRSLSANPQPNNDDLRETINKIKERHAQSKNDEPSNGDMPKPKFSENGVKTRKKSTSEEDSSKLPPKSPGLTRKPFFATQTSQQLKEAKTKQDPAKVLPRWLRSNSKEDLDDINGVLYVDKLAQYIKDHNMSGPVYKILQRQPKGGPLLYGCQIKVNDQNHSSYPDETMDAESAMELAAKKAYTKLIENEQFISPVTVTNDLELICSRVIEMVNDFTGGVWANEVAKMYAVKYNETLPENWLTMLASCPALSMSATINGEVVLYAELYADTTRLQEQQQQAEDVVDINEAELRLSNCEIHLPLEPEVVPITKTVLPSDNCWDVFISNLESSNAVYVRLIGEQFSGKYESMIDEMERYYSGGFGSKVPLEAIEIGLFYVGQLNDAWFRVCVYDMLEDDQHFNCFLIDVGEWEKINKYDVYYMERHFCRLQPQAVLCSLAGIDDLEDDVLYNEIHELLFGKVFVATVDSRNDDIDEYSVTLHDTSVDPNVNINKKILNLIDSMHQPLNLLKSSVIKEVYVSHIKENGNLFVQLQTPCFDELTKLCQQLDEQLIVTHRVPSAALLTKDKRYLAKFSADGEYYRTALTGEPAPHDNQVEMMFIDFGNVEKVNVADISQLEVLSPALYKIHPQAVEVKLHEVTVDQTGYKKLKELIPVSEMVLVRVLDDACAPPEVEVFRRHVQADGTNQLVSVNSTIAFEQSLAKTNQLRRSMRRKGEVTSAAPQAPPLSPNDSPPRITNNKIPETVHHKLVAPDIPDASSEFFDVYILLAVNPTNFMIQPLATVRKLGELTCEMTRFYQMHAGQFAVRSDDLIVGGLYAALSDGEFLRVTLASKVDSTMLSVYVCDSGDYRIVDVDDLRYLDASFTKLPYQAVKATLFGIRAVDGDWSTESCFFFQRLVVEKDLVSVVKERIPDPQGKHPFVLSLILIDTSGVEDINIRHELVKNNIAVFTT